MLLRILIVTALLAQGLVGEEVADSEPDASEVDSPSVEEEHRLPIAQPKVRGPDPAGDKIDLGPLGPLGSFGGPPLSGPPDAWTGDMPKIVQLDVKCEKNFMKVLLAFDKPFYGIVFSKGHYSNANCVHLPSGLGKSSIKFEVGIHACGTQGNTENGLYGYGADSGSGTYFENTIVIQYDPQVQEVWDQARKLRCTWHEQYEKAVTFRPFAVDMLDVVRADFAGDNVGCWMQIQVGKGPWASEVSGLVKIGQTMTMVLAIKEDDNKFDMLVRNCMAHDGKRAPIQLVDQRGCVTRSKLMSRFTKIKNFGASASVLSYAHFQAFKFPDSMEVHFQCTIQICRYQCPDQCATNDHVPDELYGPPVDHYLAAASAPVAAGRPRDERRARRATPDEQEEVGVRKVIRVVSTGDLTFSLDDDRNETSSSTLVFPVNPVDKGFVCMTTLGFASTLMVLLMVLLVSCLLSAALYCKLRPVKNVVPKHGRAY
ncbi:cuticlin-4 [Cloeon dipterum]|uniref:cuticlin-4 n=1 Tax=Cloeon dipterum TaxID=197152 RepID=UPI0032200660